MEHQPPVTLLRKIKQRKKGKVSCPVVVLLRDVGYTSALCFPFMFQCHFVNWGHKMLLQEKICFTVC